MVQLNAIILILMILSRLYKHFLDLVGSYLEYVSLIWEIKIINHSNQIESIQNNVLIFYKCNITRQANSGYVNIIHVLNIITLKYRKQIILAPYF